MVRLLMLEHDSRAAELALQALRSAGVACECDCVHTEGEFRQALAGAPDLILSSDRPPGWDALEALSTAKAEQPGAPFIFIVEDKVEAAQGEAAAGQERDIRATEYVAKSDLSGLVTAVCSALHLGRQRRRAADHLQMGGDTVASGTATRLLERKAALDRTLDPGNGPTLSSILISTPPSPVALVMIKARVARDRYVKILHNASIELEVASHLADVLARLVARTHALLFTDQLDVVRAARQLSAGAATHIVYVAQSEEGSEGLRAGANDIMPDEARGEQFWAHLTIARRIVSFADSLQTAVTDNRILSTIDELTRCGNRRFFEHQFPREVARTIRYRRPLALLMCDIDHFKAINDSHGHQAGDDVLREFGDRLTDGLRLGQDWVARIGGEEFAIVLPETGGIQARAIAQRLCTRVAATAFVTTSNSLRLTASFGICAVQNVSTEVNGLSEKMVLTADGALYKSKRNGRNRVTEATVITGGSEEVCTDASV